MNLNMDNSNFAYNATIKLSDLPKCKTQSDFPGVSDLSVTSRIFPNYHDCSNSVKRFMENVVQTVNTDLPEEQRFMITTEVNPVYSGVDTKSKDWVAGELARLWIFENVQEELSTITAVGRAQVFIMDKEPVEHLN